MANNSNTQSKSSASLQDVISNDKTPGNKSLPIRITVSEAARLFGVSTKTIRVALKTNQIRYIVVNNRYKISFESLLDWSQRSTRRRNQLSTSGIGQYVQKWNIRNKKYSPDPELLNRLKKL